MQTHELRYFLAAARQLNFTRAAAECGVSQPALTRAIQKLESELGGELFHRRPGHIELSRLARALLPKLEDIERSLADVRREAQAATRESAVSLRLGAMCTISPVHVITILQQVRLQVPEADITIQDVTSAAVIDLLAVDEIEIGVTAHPELPDTIAAQSLFEERFVVALPEGHALARNPVVEFGQLEGQDYLERIGCEFDATFEMIHGAWPFEFNVVYASQREDWIQALVAAGQGCAILPETMPCLPGIVTRPLVSPEVRRTVRLANLRGRKLSPVGQSFLRAAAVHRWMVMRGPAQKAPARPCA